MLSCSFLLLSTFCLHLIIFSPYFCLYPIFLNLYFYFLSYLLLSVYLLLFLLFFFVTLLAFLFSSILIVFHYVSFTPFYYFTVTRYLSVLTCRFLYFSLLVSQVFPILLPFSSFIFLSFSFLRDHGFSSVP
ncbi:membrane hypothetical protein [Gammaproteobacteria bacterium]